MRVGFVGAGRAARALAPGLARQGYAVAAVTSRTPASAAELAARLPGCRSLTSAEAVAEQVDLVFLTVPDDAIAVVAADTSWRPGMAVVHCSGAASLDVLAAAARAGARTGSFHPLQTLAGADDDWRRLRGSAFALEAEEPLASELEAMARALGGRPLRLGPGQKALYHASAVLACNYLVTLASLATELWGVMGQSQGLALAALLPLMRGTVDNLERAGLPGALTGPIARGDVGTVRRHVSALAQGAPTLLELYCRLGLATLDVALARGGLAGSAAEEMRQVLMSGSTNGRGDPCV